MMAILSERSTRFILPKAVYVLHAFQKKSTRGIATRQSDITLVGEGLKIAQRDYEESYDQKESRQRHSQ